MTNRTRLEALEVGAIAEYFRHRGFTHALRALVQCAPECFDGPDATHALHESDPSSRETPWLRTLVQRELSNAVETVGGGGGGGGSTSSTTELSPGDGRFPRQTTSVLDTLHSGGILCVCVVHWEGCAYLLTSSADRTLKVSLLATGEVVNMLDLRDPNGLQHSPVHHGPILSIRAHPKRADIVLTTSMDGTHALLRWTEPGMDGSAAVLQRWRDHGKYVVRGEFSPDGRYFATASYDRTVNVYERAGDCESVVDENGAVPEPPYRHLCKREFGGPVEGLCFVDGRTVVVSARQDNYLHYLTVEPAAETLAETRYNMNANGDDHVSFTAMHLSPSPPTADDPAGGRYLLASTDQPTGRAILFRSHSSQHVQNFYGVQVDGFSQPRHCWHSSGRYVFLTSDEDRAVWVMEVSTGQCVHTLTKHQQDGGQQGSSSSGDGHQAIVRTLCYDDVEECLITGSFDKTVRIWK